MSINCSPYPAAILLVYLLASFPRKVSGVNFLFYTQVVTSQLASLSNLSEIFLVSALWCVCVQNCGNRAKEGRKEDVDTLNKRNSFPPFCFPCSLTWCSGLVHFLLRAIFPFYLER